MALPEDQSKSEWRRRALARRIHDQRIDYQQLDARARWITLPQSEREHALGFSIDGDVDLVELGGKAGERRRTIDRAGAIRPHPEGKTLESRTGVKSRGTSRIAAAGRERKQEGASGCCCPFTSDHESSSIRPVCVPKWL